MVGAQSLGAGYFPMEDVQPFLGEESSGLGGGVVDPFLKKASYQASLLFNTLNNFFLNNSIFSAATISISHPLESPPVGNQTDAVGTAAGQSDAGVGNRPA